MTGDPPHKLLNRLNLSQLESHWSVGNIERSHADQVEYLYYML